MIPSDGQSLNNLAPWTFHHAQMFTFMQTLHPPMFSATVMSRKADMKKEDLNKVLVWFEVVEADDEVNVSIRSCSVLVTEELHGIQTEVKWPVGVPKVFSCGVRGLLGHHNDQCPKIKEASAIGGYRRNDS
ncbi:disease resistance protein RPP4-like [Cucumis melo var. makuwa]|uniref:Disease resistance protein RPP4-like n=1 Tax=Cucumis melo var. makuwa TaxID=1194695 RepID=A0A5A7UND4_CUCMM|nr:disease resistance protein RPP4-like [Cucumis melo var. makuwa]